MKRSGGLNAVIAAATIFASSIRDRIEAADLSAGVSVATAAAELQPGNGQSEHQTSNRLRAVVIRIVRQYRRGRSREYRSAHFWQAIVVGLHIGQLESRV